ncbi:MAG: phage major capsid protein [Rhodothalassiaceae bacterium]
MTDETDAETDAVAEVKAAVDQLGAAFEAFRQDHDRAEIERSLKGQADVLIEEKLGRVSQEMDRLTRRIDLLQDHRTRPGVGGFEPVDEHKAAFFDGYVRRGLEQGLAGYERKALVAGMPADGGYAVPEALDQAIERRLRQISPLRSIATVVQIGTGDYKKLVATSGTASGWVSETAARSETDTPSFAEVVPPLGELYANPAATQTMLDDAFFDVEAWLAEDLADEFASQEGEAFVNGNGTNKPKGVLTQPVATTGDATRPFGTLQYLASGVATGFPSSNPGDVLMDLVYSLNAGYRGEARIAGVWIAAMVSGSV